VSLHYVLLLVLVFSAATIVTWVAIRYALWRQLLDQPGERRSHRVTTPRGGGIGIVVSQLLACVLAVTLFPVFAIPVAVFALGLLLVAGIGWWDDHRALPALPRLCVHLLAALLLGAMVWAESGSLLKALFCAGLAVSLINIWNFMDGINGLAATQAIIVGLGAVLLLPQPYSFVAYAFVVGCAGFLPFNFPRARVFMGDVGSGALGYLVAGLLALGLCVTEVAPVLWLLLPVAFFIDAGFTLLLRILNGEPWMEAHTQHLYQRFVKRDFSHFAVTLGYVAFSLIGLTIAVVFSRLPLVWGWAGGSICIAAAAVIWISFRARSIS
jgi:UDP-N-acetylmuramyl pentapeptide phosphotransferase/UDP-N-acetylglucosamine-1-phosphate transferase